MITCIVLCLRHRGRASGLKSVSFKKGFNTIIGPNGSGKSSILKAIFNCPDCVREDKPKTVYRYYNAETMNPHRSGKPFTGVVGSIIKVRAMFSSHGETMRDVLRFFEFAPGDCLLIDEPEYGQDLGWVVKIRKGLDRVRKEGCQVIAASHHPAFWNNCHLIELKRGYRKANLKTIQNLI